MYAAELSSSFRAPQPAAQAPVGLPDNAVIERLIALHAQVKSAVDLAVRTDHREGWNWAYCEVFTEHVSEDVKSLLRAAGYVLDYAVAGRQCTPRESLVSFCNEFDRALRNIMLVFGRRLLCRD